jgi:DNA-binding PadR family transcriptional regulator
MASPPKLTTTSYAILGQLALRDWTMYELAREMARNLHFFFPRAESQVYVEPKKLVALGLASARSEATGARRRTVYAITEAGRAELARWLAQPPAKGVQIEFEAVLRLLYAGLGSEADLRRTLEAVRADIEALLTVGEGIRHEYLEGRAPFQRFIATRSMVHDFLWSFALLVDAWAERSLARVDAWAGQTEAERIAAARDVYRRRGPSRLQKPLPDAGRQG